MDPCLVLERKQEGTCLGCVLLERSRWSGTTKYVCSTGQQKASTEWTEMRRCKKYNDGVSMTSDQSSQIEELLGVWYDWQCRQSKAETRALDFKPDDRTCRGYQSPPNDEDSEDAYRWADDQQSEQVQLCVDELPIEQRAAISTKFSAAYHTEARNREIGKSVWSSGRAEDRHVIYQAAKERLFPMFVARHLVKSTESA
jgi:hypothetical protein